MNNEHLQDKFVKFLMDRDITSAYRANLKGISTIQQVFDQFPSPEDWVEDPFTWRETKQGDDFWNSVDDDWLEILDESKEQEEEIGDPSKCTELIQLLNILDKFKLLDSKTAYSIGYNYRHTNNSTDIVAALTEHAEARNNIDALKFINECSWVRHVRGQDDATLQNAAIAAIKQKTGWDDEKIIDFINDSKWRKK